MVNTSNSIEAVLDSEITEEKLQEDSRSKLKKFADWYFKPKPFEKNGTLYEYLGVKLFRGALMNTVGKFREYTDNGQPSNYFIGEKRTLRSMKIFESGTRFNEFIHAYTAAHISGLLLNDFYYGNNDNLESNAICLGINLYCVFLQRYHRAKLQPVIEHFEKNKKLEE